MVKYAIVRQSIKDMIVDAVTTNGLPFFSLKIRHRKDACSDIKSTETKTYSF